MSNKIKIDSKTKNNAMISYLLIFISIFFLSNKENQYINNDFVKNHTKTAFFIHILFFLTWVFFKYIGLGKNIVYFDISLDYVIFTCLLIFLFILLLIGAFKAFNGEEFTIGNVIKITKTKKFLDVNKNSDFDEKDKLTILLGYIPFIGMLINGKYYKYNNQILQKVTKLMYIISFLIVLFYVIGKNDISSLVFLLYLIYVVFTGIMLFIKNDLFLVNTENIPLIQEFNLYTKGIIIYLNNYIKKDFKNFNEVLNTTKENLYREEIKEVKKLNQLSDIKIPKILIYIPILNLISLFYIKSKYKNHIINGLIITFIFILVGIFLEFTNRYQLLLLFPIVTGYSYIDRLEYKIPFLFDLYIIIKYIIKKIANLFGLLKDKHKEEHTFIGKVNEK